MKLLRVTATLLIVACCSLEAGVTTRYIIRRKSPKIRRLGMDDNGFEYATKRKGNRGDVYEYHNFQHYGYKTPSPHKDGIKKALALLAPLAILPFLASVFGPMPTMPPPPPPPQPVMFPRLRKRDIVVDILSSTPNVSAMEPVVKHDIRRDLRDLDVIQKYLQQSKPRPDYNDEVMATYLQCSGMLGPTNHCLERLTCQFSDPSSPLSDLEKDVSSLIIFTIFKNRFINEDFKERLRNAAIFARDSPGRCGRFACTNKDYSFYKT